MSTRSTLSAAAALLLAVGAASCGSGSKVQYPTTPKFLIAADGNGAGTNVNVFPVDATTGALGTAVSGSPFDLGLTDGMTLAVHPNGHFVYAADGNDGSIHSWNVSESTGVPKQIAAKVINESGSFYQPSGSGQSPTNVLTITPNGNFLYSANNDATVGAYKINSDGSLAHIADLNVGACSTGAITATNSFVWVTDTCPAGSSGGPWHVMTMKIGSNGALSNVSTATLTSVYSWLWSIQVNPAANFLYVGDEGGTAQIYSFSIASDGSLTQLGPQFPDASSSDCRDIVHSPDGKFFYWTDDDDYVHAFSVDTTTGAIAELASSPYKDPTSGNFVGGAGQVVVDLTGHFVYLGDVYNTGGVLGFTRDATTGALTRIGSSATATANKAALAIGIVR